MTKQKRIFLTGGSGFIGSVILEKLLEKNHEITVLLRNKSKLKTVFRNDRNVHVQIGDVTDPVSLQYNMTGHDAVIHLVGIIREIQTPHDDLTFDKLHTRATYNVMAEARSSGIKRFIHMSALGTRENAETRYHQTKWEAEEIVRKSGLDFTIFRPSLVYGSDDQFTNMIAGMARRFRIFPLIDGGKSLMQPISGEDVAECFVRAIDNEKAIGKTYEIGGPEKITFRELVKTIAKAMRIGVLTPYIPAWLVRSTAENFEMFNWFPITSEQLKMLLKDNVTDETSFQEDFGISPISFYEGISKYVKPK